MADYTQAKRFMAVTTPLGEDALLLIGLQGGSALDRHFLFQLELLAENATRIDFGQLLGQEIGVRIHAPEGPPRHWHGIVRRIRRGQRDRVFTHYRIEMAPRLWRLSQRSHCRVFQQQTVPDIIAGVLDGVLAKDQYAFRNLYGDYRPRDYCVQYRESDLAFICRLMEEEGLSFYHQHSEHEHKLVITDTPFDQLDAVQARLPFQEAGLATELWVNEWAVSQEVRPSRSTLGDYCFEMAGKRLEASEPVRPGVEVGQTHHDLSWGGQDLEWYHYPGGYADRFDGIAPGGGDRRAALKQIFDDGRRTARLRMEEQAAQALRIEGASNCPALYPGYHFQLSGHPDSDGLYLITAVEHSARLSGYRSGEDLRFEYANRFVGLPKGLPYRPPRRTPKPVIAGPQTAVVVGPPGQQIFVDRYGRVKVQFHWDRQGQRNASSSCWVRVAQVWAGQRWGAFFWPRIGHEVVVAFEEADPDRPLIVGSVYNDQNLPPVDLPAGAGLGGVKSCIIGGDPLTQFNALVFHDTPGVEYVEVHSKKAEMSNSEVNRVHCTNKAQFVFRGSFT